ncbi:MAG: 3-dehydroquinate synthase [Gammaproteobacteria bacterium]|nr:3-dehydroquinate synthase [Gammaproteobacteria bacterium]
MKTLTVRLGRRTYPIHVGTDLLADADLLTPHIDGRQVMVISNNTVGPMYLDKLHRGLQRFDVFTHMIPDGESYKNLDVLEDVFDRMLEIPCSRQCTVIALGGGVVGDIAGFAAACYQRGIPFIQAPTTLLAQVDSSVGGKTAVNHRLGKNMIGALYQPRAVIADTATLETLPDNEFSAGLAEVIKYGLIRDPEFFVWLESNIDALRRRDHEALTHAIERSCRNKAEIVAMDEHETDIRALLNLGHTFGHAIEAATQYKSWLHGEAVAVGMLMAADLSRRLGDLQERDVERIKDLLQRTGLPTHPPKEMTPDTFERYMAVDKKVVDGRVRLVLLKRPGRAYVGDEYGFKALRDTLAAFQMAV